MTRRWRLRLTDQAERDLQDIVRWTAENFGVRQAQDYGRTLALALEVLGTGPDEPGSRAREDLAPGIRTLHAGRRGRKARHFVVFGVGTDGTVDVLRVLHDSVDLARHIPGADDSSH
jgi:toxin ParE1/3/4